jgi:hypothetical protein
MLTIRHQNGALAGNEVAVDPAKDRVVFGRQLDCDVQYPPEETAVSRHHFALARKPSGSWTIELFGEPFVAVNGVPADSGDVVRDGATFELGKIGGPSFKVSVSEDARSDNYLRTNIQETAPTPRTLATRAGALGRVARALAAVALVAVAGVGGFAAYNYFDGRATTARLESAQAAFAEAQAREAKLRISAETRAHVARAVYQVQLEDTQKRFSGEGTAWVLGANSLATNAHVALLREGLRDGERMVVRAPGQNGAVYEVTGHKLHPGYVPFKAFLQADRRLISLFRGEAQGLGGNGYDVAILTVKGTLPESDRLMLATPEEINDLAPGTPLITAGYPAENMFSTWAHTRGATPEQHLGIVTSVTDMFHLPSSVELRQLVHNDLPTTGGQSGSPVVGASGRVVAVLNSINLIMTDRGRIPSAALVNFAQRADLVRDMLDGTAEKKLVAARQHWQSVGQRFAEAKNVLPQMILKDARPADGMQPKLLAEIKRNMIARAGKRTVEKDQDVYSNVTVLPQKLTPGYDYSFLVIAEDGKARIDVFVGGNKIGQVAGSNYPSYSCRLLTPPQQNSGDPQKPRPACASGHERASGMLIPEGHAADRSVELLLYNIKGSTDALAGADLSYTLRIYQWAAGDPRRPTASR